MTKLAALMCASSVLAIAGTAQAQAPDAAVEEVVITGSRIARQDYTAESPIVTIGAEAIEVRGPETLEKTFNLMPQFAASNMNSSSNPLRQGRSNANLRGLGIQRTLVLLDGRRMQPSDAFGAIDMNSIATGLINNVEVITGGASAVYGSDAIAGVINFKLKRNFQGVELDAQYGETSRDDGQSVNVALNVGGNFADERGNIVASLTYFQRDPVARLNREFFYRSGISNAPPGGIFSTPANNLPTRAAVDQVFTRYGIAAGAVPTNSTYSVNDDDTLFTIINGINLRFPDFQPYVISQGRVGWPQGNTYPLIQPMERYTAFIKGRYAFSDTVEGYIQLNHMNYHSTYFRHGYGAGNEPRPVVIPITNPFIPADLRTILASRPTPGAGINYNFGTGRITPVIQDSNYDINEVLIGLNGSIPSLDWTWDIYASGGKTTDTEVYDGGIHYQSLLNLVNSPTGGADICPGGFNPFEYRSLSDTPGQEACVAYLNRITTDRAEHGQHIVEGQLQGGLFDLPAGELRFAAGAGYRKMTYKYVPSAERRFGTMLGFPTPINPAEGDYNVREAFVEVYIPTLRDLPLIEELNFDVAGRLSDYSSVGEVSTYKASVDWRIAAGMSFRGGYQRAIRAPSLGELYTPDEESASAVGTVASGGGDPCDFTSRYRAATNPDRNLVRSLCLAQGVPIGVIDLLRVAGSSVPTTISGNPNLQEETADTYTAGLVWQSRFDHPLLARLSASLDYYDISVEGAIGTVTASVGLQRCFNSDGFSNPTYDVNNFFCRQTTRGVNGTIINQKQPALNLGGYKTTGVDFQTDWGFDVAALGAPDWGRLSFNLIVSYLRSFEIQNLAGAPFVDYSGTIGNAQIDVGTISFPKWKASFSTTYSVGPYDFTASARWVDAMENSANRTLTAGAAQQPGVTTRAYLDLTARYRFDDKTEFRMGVLNVVDTEPPVWTGEGNTDTALYDIIQRRFYLGVNRRF